MSPEDVRSNVVDELKLADAALRAGEALLGLDLPADAASRIHYAAFHAARALLYSVGIAPRSHEAVQTLFSREFVKPGRVPRELAKTLPTLEALRLDGDYDSNFALGVEDLRSELDRARRFIDEAKRVLNS